MNCKPSENDMRYAIFSAILVIALTGCTAIPAWQGHGEAIMELNLLAGWVGMFLGVVSGAVIGLFFHRPDWMGGYASYRRRLTRLGHISFFGLGFLNLFFALTLSLHAVPVAWAQVSSIGLIVGAVTMPACCFLAAWRKPLRVLFPIPVLSTGLGIFALLLHWNTTAP